MEMHRIAYIIDTNENICKINRKANPYITEIKNNIDLMESLYLKDKQKERISKQVNNFDCIMKKTNIIKRKLHLVFIILIIYLLL